MNCAKKDEKENDCICTAGKFKDTCFKTTPVNSVASENLTLTLLSWSEFLVFGDEWNKLRATKATLHSNAILLLLHVFMQREIAQLHEPHPGK